jgi:hypothetical protein
VNIISFLTKNPVTDSSSTSSSTHLGSLERPWSVDDSYRIFGPEMGQWPALNLIESPTFFNFGHDGTLSMRNFVVIMVQIEVQMIKSSLGSMILEACMAFGLLQLLLATYTNIVFTFFQYRMKFYD